MLLSYRTLDNIVLVYEKKKKEEEEEEEYTCILGQSPP